MVLIIQVKDIDVFQQAAKGKMEITMGVAIGSSIQMFVVYLSV